jgi:sigma-E factor negative regulatory protein RseC
MKETGRVVETLGRDALVEFERTSACESCGACRRFGAQTMRLTLQNAIGARPGDRVVVEMDAKSVVSASLWAYAFPLAMLFLGALVGERLWQSGLFSAQWPIGVLALCAAGLGFGVLRLLTPYFAKKRSLAPMMVEIIGTADDIH